MPCRGRRQPARPKGATGAPAGRERPWRAQRALTSTPPGRTRVGLVNQLGSAEGRKGEAFVRNGVRATALFRGATDYAAALRVIRGICGQHEQRPRSSALPGPPTPSGTPIAFSPRHSNRRGHVQLDSLQALYVDELKDLYSAEKQILKALPKLIKAASHEELAATFSEHMRVTERQ